MVRWFRRVLAGFGQHFELLGRIEELEFQIQRLEAIVRANELEWCNEVDKVTAISKRLAKRIQDGTAAMAEATPSITDMRAQRAARKVQLRARRAQQGGADAVSS